MELPRFSFPVLGSLFHVRTRQPKIIARMLSIETISQKVYILVSGFPVSTSFPDPAQNDIPLLWDYLIANVANAVA